MISLRIKPKSKPPEPSPPTPGSFSIAELFERAWEDLGPVPYDPREVTLRLDFDSIGVQRITAAKFRGNSRSVLSSIDITSDAYEAADPFDL